MENPCYIYESCFSQGVFDNATLYVPQGTIEKYKTTDYWNKFVFIEEGDPTDISIASHSRKVIQAHDGIISVSDVDDGKQIAIYQTDGKQVATTKAQNGTACVATNISKGTPVFVKIGDKAVKVMMR